MFPYAFIPRHIQYSKTTILFERDIANLSDLELSSTIHVTQALCVLDSTELSTPSIDRLLLYGLALVEWPRQKAACLKIMDKMCTEPACPWSADVSCLARRVCVGSNGKVAVLSPKRDLQDLFFSTDEQTQLFKYGFFCPASSLLPSALVWALFVAGEAGFVTTPNLSS